MDVIDAIRGRRSIRKFQDRPIQEEELDLLIECAILSPNAGNQQAWQFALITSPEVKKMLLKFAPGIFRNPPAIILVCAKEEKTDAESKLTYMADCAIAAQNIMLAAYGLGIGSCPIFSYSKTAWKEILGIPGGIEPYIAITLGYPAESPAPPQRKKTSDVAFLNIFGTRWGS
jgi:nitroreductase